MPAIRATSRARIAAADRQLFAFVEVFAERARDEAKALDAARPLGLELERLLVERQQLVGLELERKLVERKLVERELLVEHGLDADRSWPFSDSVNDLPLLTMVGHPVATNADPELARIARTNDWRVLSCGNETEWSSGLGTLYPFPY